MDGEKKRSGTKRRPKPVEIGHDSDDDEPIGSIFKLRKQRNCKKSSVALEGTGDGGKNAEATGKKLVAAEEDLGGMDDTLASFRKRLKGPKRDLGSGTTSGRSFSSNVIGESADRSINEGQAVDDSGCDFTTNIEITDSCQGKVEGTKMDPALKGIEGQAMSDDEVVVRESMNVLKDEGGLTSLPGEGLQHFSDEYKEDSLSAIFQKAQSRLTRKFRTCSSSRHSSGSHTVDEGVGPLSKSVPETVESVDERRSRPASASKVVRDDRKSSHDLSQALDSCPSASVSVMDNPKFVDGSLPEETAGICDSNIDDGPTFDPYLSTNVCIGGSQQLSGHQYKDICPHSHQNFTLQERTLDDGLKHCSTVSPDVGNVVDTASSLKVGEQGEGELRKHLTKESAQVCNGCADTLNENNQLVLLKLLEGSLRNGHLKLSGSGCTSQMDGGLKSDCCTLDTKAEGQNVVSDILQEKNVVLSDGTYSSVVSNDKSNESEMVVQLNQPEKPSDTGMAPNNSTVFMCSTLIGPIQSSVDDCKEGFLPNDDHLYDKKEALEASSPSAFPEENKNYTVYEVSRSDGTNCDTKISAVQRRKARKRRHGDMAYEGDVDWETLINDQVLLESQGFVNNDRTVRARVMLDSSLNVVDESESAAAAVSAGLKAHAAGPLERIRFKEILKRKGGLQEYLDCRNHILSLWSRDVTRILPLADCGVSDTPFEGEPSQSSLIRDVYTFLDQCGYINVGIASQKEKSGTIARHCNIVKEKGFEESSAASVADSEDGVSFIVGQAKRSDSMDVKNNLTVNYENLTPEAPEGRGHTDPGTLDLSSLMQHEERKVDDYQENGKSQAELSGLIHVDVFDSKSASKVLDCRVTSVIAARKTNEPTCVNASDDQVVDYLQSDSDTRKKVIVIGAGPAGLTAARHLQRQGFFVTVLEARSRIGGRVFTDHSSLSVPVDLGASIITGVEADVATERRPDPSALVCAQLGLELTVLNSDCPLYDIATGQKVPADMDEALEAEYNSLLDDMVLLIDQKGEQAMRMSLEDGLEYDLKRRHIVRYGRSSSSDASFASKRGSMEEKTNEEDTLSPLERRVMNWHFAHLEYGCAAPLKEVSLPYWNQDDVYGGFGGAHCMIKGGYSNVVESLGEGLDIHLNHVVTNVAYAKEPGQSNEVKVTTSNGSEFNGDAVLITVPLGCLKADSIKFSPPLPQWKYSSIQRLGYGVLNKVILEFPSVFWDDTVDYFGATAEETSRRGNCFMFWNVRKTVGAPVLIALVVGKAAIDGQNLRSFDHVSHALMVLRKLFGESSVPDPVAYVVTDWGRDPFSYGAYSYVAVGSSGEDYDILGRPVGNCLFFAGEATCKEHPDTVGGAMMSGLREAVRIIDILSTGNDYTAEVEAMEAAQRHSDERDEVRDIIKRLDAVEFSNVLYKNALDDAQILTREALLRDMFFDAKTNAGRLHVAKELLSLPVANLKSFAGSKEGLAILNSWILDSMGKAGTQLLRQCVRLLVRVSTDLLAVRLSGIGKTVKEKVCVHTSRDIRGIASQLVSVWLEIFRKGKASNGRLKLSRQATAIDNLSKRKPLKESALGKPPLSTHHGDSDVNSASPASVKKLHSKQVRQVANDSRHEVNSSRSQGSTGNVVTEEEDNCIVMSEEEQAAIAAAEAARAKVLAAAEALAASCDKKMELPKIPSFHKFARREQYLQNDEFDSRKKWSGGVLGRQDSISEIDSRNDRVINWFSTDAACVNLENSRMSVDNLSQRSHSNEIASHLNLREHSGESIAVDSSIYTKAWIDTAGGVGVKDYHAIERWQSQAAAADSEFSNPTMHAIDEEDSNNCPRIPSWKRDGMANESSVSQVTVNKEVLKTHPRGADRIKQAVVDYVASLLMPLYKARKLDKDGYKAIMKKSATKVMEQATDAEKAMAVYEFLDFKRKNKIRSFVDKLIERHMAMKADVKS